MQNGGSALNYHEIVEPNRLNWESRVDIHFRDATGFYRLNLFRTDPTYNALTFLEREELKDVLATSPKCLHLQCHIGTDSISLTRAGASQVVGVDFSSKAVQAATLLAKDCNAPCSFVCANVFDIPSAVTERDFDLVFSSWGTYGWLPDLKPWASAIYTVLKPGGLFYICDGHPVLFQLDNDTSTGMRVKWPWRTDANEPLVMSNNTHTYTGDGDILSAQTTHEFNHPISRILTSLLDAGLQLVFFNEHEAIPWKGVDCMVPIELPDKSAMTMYKLPDSMPKIPLSFSLLARKP